MADPNITTKLTSSLLSVPDFRQPVLYVTDDGGVFVTDTTDANDADSNDINLLPATPEEDDATYFGHATKTFCAVHVAIGTAGAGTWTITWEYWDGSDWTALAGVVDGSTGFTVGPGTYIVSFTVPSDWAVTTVNSLSGYWVRARVATYSAVTTQPLGTKAWVVVMDNDATMAVPGQVQTATFINLGSTERVCIRLDGGTAVCTGADSDYTDQIVLIAGTTDDRVTLTHHCPRAISAMADGAVTLVVQLYGNTL